MVSEGKLLAGIEFKSQVGSFGNNYNNRTEEAIGSAADIWYPSGGPRRHSAMASIVENDA